MTTTNDASAPAPSGSGVRVKPLEWHKPNDGGTLSRADTIIGIARVWTHHEANGAWFWSIENHASGQEANETDAKKMLWATYEHRILSALASDASPRGGAVAWRYRSTSAAIWNYCEGSYPRGIGAEIVEALYAHPAPATVERLEAVEAERQACAEIVRRVRATWINGDATTAIGNAFQRACDQALDGILGRSREAALAPATEGRKG